MNPELLKWALGAVGACTVAIVGAVVWLATLVFKVGQKAGAVEKTIERLEKSVEKVDKVGERLEMIPLIKQQVEQLALTFTEERRRFNSVFPDLQHKVTTLWEKVFSLAEWRKSRPNIGNGSSGHGE